MGRCRIEQLRIESLEKRNPLDLTMDLSRDMADSLRDAREGAWIKGSELKTVVQLVLREILWCRLRFPYRFFVHFGYEYYMYVGCRLNLEETRQTVADQTLFVEPFKSPYL